MRNIGRSDGKSGRNQDIEMLRGIAMLLILFYHYTQIIPGIMNTHWLQMLDEGLCQLAMVLFFSISGFGTYIYLHKHTDEGMLAYVKKRFFSIAPQYYFCLIVLLLTVGAGYLAWNQIFRIGALFAFAQNLFVSTNTMLNGAAWTISLMMQFYLIAPLIYKMLQRYGAKIYIVAILFSFSVRALISLYLERIDADSFYYVVYSIRQIYTTIDIFIGGMIAGKQYLEQKNISAPIRFRLSLPILLFITLGSFLGLVYTPISNYIWGAHIRSWLWPPLLGLEVAVLLYMCTGLQFKYQSLIGKVIQFIAKNEYGIYLWHIPLITSLSSKSPMYAGLLGRSRGGLLIVMCFLAVMVGKISNDLLKRFTKKNN